MARKRKKYSNLKWILLSVLFVLLVAGALFGYHFYSYIYGRNVKLETETTDFYIQTGWDFEKVTEALQEKNIIKNEQSFIWVATRKNYTNKVRSGKYTIRNHWSNSELIDLLRAGKQTPVKVTFHNISRLTQLAGLVSEQIEADSTKLISAFLDENWMRDHKLNSQTMQAIFIPNTYEVYWNITAEQFVKRMYQEYQHFWSVANQNKAEAVGLTPLQVSTLASIVEAETKKRDEMPKVAGLYINRLAIGMRLQSDPTVVFALNRPGIHRVYFDDLKIQSPYNTYIHSGLPPGPIGFPGTSALNAVLNPFKSNYIYMCAKPDYSGYHNFASSYSAHQRNAATYRAFLRKEGIR